MKRLYQLFLAGCMLFGGILSSCDSNEPTSENKPEPAPVEQEKPEAEPTPWEYLDLTSIQRSTNESTRKFASNLLLTCLDYENSKNGEKNNIFISPLGLSNILTMLGNGTDDGTLKEITDVLGADLNNLNSFYSLMAEWLPKADNQVTFSTANSAWVQNGFKPLQSYMDFIGSHFNADIFNRDLASNETKDEINKWCSDKTDGMIPEFLKEPLKDCVMFLANALYFNGKWTEPFDADENTFEKFYSVVSGTKEVEMMHGQMRIAYQKTMNGELVSIPYGNGTYSFNILLPSEGITLEEALTTGECLKSVRSGECYLTMPKFDLSYRNEDFKDLCEAMGINLLFNSPNALPKIAENLCCDKIIQEAKLEVNESGAKAAAVTGAMMDVTANIDAPTTTPAVVVVNRPFIFSITASNHDIVLFAGIVRNL